MISLIEHIEYLMACNDCVVVPGWGALIAQYQHSTFNGAAGIINKPKRTVSFNAEVIHNDGLLAQSLMRRHGLSFEDATKQIALNVAQFKQILATGAELPFGRLGFFKSTSDGKMEFVPFYNANGFNDFFGLQAVSLPMLQQHASAPMGKETNAEPASKPAQPIAATSRRNPFISSYLRIAASIIVLICLYLTLSTPVAVNFDNQNTASLSLPKIKQQPRQTIKAVAPHVTADTTAAKAQTADSLSGKFYLVVSTFQSEAKAEKYIAQNPGIKAKILKRGKTYRVYVARSDNYSTLINHMKTLPKEYQTAWVSD